MSRSSFVAAVAPYAALLGAIVSLSVGTSFAKSLFPVAGAAGTTALRVGFGALILLAVWRPWRLPLSRRRAAMIAVYGVVLGVMNLLFYQALRTIPLGLAVAIEFIGPMAVAILSSRRRVDFVWIGLAAAGLMLLLPIGPSLHRLDPAGVGFALAAAVCWALYIVFGQRAGAGHVGQATSLGMTAAALVVVPIGVVSTGAPLFQPSLLTGGLVVGVLSSALPYSLEMVALRRLSRQSFGVLLSLEPAVSALAGLVVLGERLAPLQWLALACIVAASIGSAATAGRSAASAGPAAGAAP